MQQIYQLHYELDELWDKACMESIVKCQDIFSDFAMKIVLRKWTANALDNEISYKRKIQDNKEDVREIHFFLSNSQNVLKFLIRLRCFANKK